MIVKVDHVGIAVRALGERLPFWRDLLGLTVAGEEVVATEGVRVAFLPAGPTRVELLEAVRDDSAVAKFVARRGEGIHHITFQVDGIQEVLDRLSSAGVPMLDRAPRDGASGSRVAFLHPRATGGVLVELVERGPGAVLRAGAIAPGEPVLAYLRDPQEKMWGGSCASAMRPGSRSRGSTSRRSMPGWRRWRGARTGSLRRSCSSPWRAWSASFSTGAPRRSRP